MIWWFRHLLAWQQIGVGLAVGTAVSVVAVATVTLSGGEPYLGSGEAWITVPAGAQGVTTPTSGTPEPDAGTSPGGEAYGGGYGGTYLGSFVVLHLSRPIDEHWDPFAAFTLYVDGQGNAHADGFCQDSFEGAWGTASIDYAFECAGIIGDDATLVCSGTSRFHWTWDYRNTPNVPYFVSLWRPNVILTTDLDESFDDIPITLTINVILHGDREPTLAGAASAAWDMTPGGDGGLGLVSGQWYGLPGTPTPLLPVEE